MRFTLITPNYNGAQYLESTIRSVIAEKNSVDLEYIIVDGGSSDDSLEIIKRYSADIDLVISEKDNGPASAINKGFRAATGDIIAWLNSDDTYFPGTLARVLSAARKNPTAAMYFGGCAIIDEQDSEIRSSITRFKEMFYPFSSRFTYQCINYLSQPSLFFARESVAAAGLLREDMVAAWDYEFILRLWHTGTAVRIPGSPLAAFRWHESSISGQNFALQFEEEYHAARADAGRFSLQTAIHLLVRFAIVAVYSAMSRRREHNKVSG